MSKRIDWDASRRRKAVFENGFIKYFWDGWKPGAKSGSHKKRPDLSDLDPAIIFAMEYEDGPRKLEKQKLLGEGVEKLFPGLPLELLISKIHIRCPALPKKVKHALLVSINKKLNRPLREKVAIFFKVHEKFLKLAWLESIRYQPSKNLLSYNYCPKKNLKKWVKKILFLDLDDFGG